MSSYMYMYVYTNLCSAKLETIFVTKSNIVTLKLIPLMARHINVVTVRHFFISRGYLFVHVRAALCYRIAQFSFSFLFLVTIVLYIIEMFFTSTVLYKS